jgi:hypothetical protein
MGGGAGRGGRYNAALISRLSSMIAAAPRVTGGGCQGSGGAKDIGGRGGERGWRGRYLIGEEASSGKESRHHRGRRGRATAGEGREGVSAKKAIREEEETIMEERGHAFPLMCDGLCVMGVLFQEGTVEA